MTDQSDKPKLGTRPPLGLKRTVETGKVKQSFSHGRSNTVVVEVKKRRILGKPGEAPPPEPKVEAAVPAPEPKPAAPAPKPAAPKRPVDDITARKEMQERLLREEGDTPVMGRYAVQGPAAEHHRTAVGAEQAGQDREEGGLAGAVGADDRHRLARGDVEREVDAAAGDRGPHLQPRHRADRFWRASPITTTATTTSTRASATAASGSVTRWR